MTQFARPVTLATTRPSRLRICQGLCQRHLDYQALWPRSNFAASASQTEKATPPMRSAFSVWSRMERSGVLPGKLSLAHNPFEVTGRVPQPLVFIDDSERTSIFSFRVLPAHRASPEPAAFPRPESWFHPVSIGVSPVLRAMPDFSSARLDCSTFCLQSQAVRICFHGCFNTRPHIDILHLELCVELPDSVVPVTMGTRLPCLSTVLCPRPQ